MTDQPHSYERAGPCPCDGACGIWHGCAQCSPIEGEWLRLGAAVRDLVREAELRGVRLAGGQGQAQYLDWSEYGSARDAVEVRLRGIAP